MVVKITENEKNVTSTLDKSEKKYNFVRKGGKSIIERRPVFSPDGQLLAVIVENTVRVYSIETGECARVLETEGHTDNLIAIEFPSDDPHNLYGCSVKGVITIWTWENGAVLRERPLFKPQDLDILAFNLISCKSCLLALGSPSQKYIQLISYSVRTGEIEMMYRNTMPEYHNMVSMSLGWINGDRFAALTNGTMMLFMQNLRQPHIYERIINHTFTRLLSVSVHNSAVAVTDALGRASILRGNLFDSRSNIGREVLHWHFLPALCSAFSLQGNYLYTGGMEKVLVKWTVGQKDKLMMPRLPGHIRFIATNNTHVVVSLSNNSIIVANALLRATCTILECGGLSPVMRAIGGTLICNQRLGGLLIPGRTGYLQLYSTATDKVLYNIDITQRNELPAERYNLLPMDTEVTCAAVSANGVWLATSEYRNDGINYPEEKLKFWYTVPKSANPVQLNTCVNLSHGGCNVVALAFDNQGNYCVSAGMDQKFRIWKRKNATGKKQQLHHFMCITACYYSSGIGQSMSHDILNKIKQHNVNTYGKDKYPYLREYEKDDILEKLMNIHKEDSLIDANVLSSGMKTNSDGDMGGVAISQDGSLIAAWFGCKLTLWDSHLCNIRTTLAHPALRPKGIQVKFGSRDASHYLVCTTENCLAVWSLLSLTIKWMVQIRPSCLAADRLSNRMAVVTQENDLFVFTPHSPTPILTRKRLLNPETGVFKQLTLGTAPGQDIRLFLMRNNSEIYTLEPEKTVDGRLETISWQHQPVSKFSAMLAADKSSGVTSGKMADIVMWDAGKAASGAAAQILSAAPHMIPPISLLSTPFLEQIIGKQNKNPEADESEKENDEEKMDVDEISSDEEEEKPLNGPSPKVMELWTPNYDAIKLKKLLKIVKEPFLDLESTSFLVGI